MQKHVLKAISTLMILATLLVTFNLCMVVYPTAASSTPTPTGPPTETPLTPTSGEAVVASDIIYKWSDKTYTIAKGLVAGISLDSPSAKGTEIHTKISCAIVGLKPEWTEIDYWEGESDDFTPYIKEMSFTIQTGDTSFSITTGDIYDNAGTTQLPGTVNFGKLLAWMADLLVPKGLGPFGILMDLYSPPPNPPNHEWTGGGTNCVEAFDRQLMESPLWPPGRQCVAGNVTHTFAATLDSHFNNEGYYPLTITAQAEIWIQDVRSTTDWTDYLQTNVGTISLTYQVDPLVDLPPDAPTMSYLQGSTGYQGVSYSYYFLTHQIYSNALQYYIDWGDGTSTQSAWISQVGTGDTEPHSWSSSGTYTITVWAQDSYLLWSQPSSYPMTIVMPLSLSISPSSVTMDVGQSQTFTSSVAGGVGPYTYQWYLNGATVSGATSSSWTFAPSSTGSYSVYATVTDTGMGGANVASSNSASVAVNPAVSVSVSPSSVTMDVGQSQVFTCTASGGTPPYTYRWGFGSSWFQSIVSACASNPTGSSWTFTPSSSGSYYVASVVVDSVNGVTYGTASVAVNPAVSVGVSPPSVTMDVSQSQVFTCTASGGTPPYTYRWGYSSISLFLAIVSACHSNPTGSSWTFTPSSSGSYYVVSVVVDSVNSAQYNSSSVTVNAAPSATISPSSVSMYIGYSQTFTSSVSSDILPYTYQWYLNGVAVSGATSTTWTFTPSSTGSYTVYLKVTDSVGNVGTSNNASVTVNSSGGGGGGGGCVLEDTRILMADGKTRRICEIKPGDKIVGYDVNTETSVTETVTSNNCTIVDEILSINKGLLFVTPTEQPIYTDHGWIKNPQDLKIGWQIYSPTEHKWITIYSLTTLKGHFRVYDLRATKPDTFVGNGILLDWKALMC